VLNVRLLLSMLIYAVVITCDHSSSTGYETIVRTVLVEASAGHIREVSNTLFLTRHVGDDGIFGTISDISGTCRTGRASLKFLSTPSLHERRTAPQ